MSNPRLELFEGWAALAHWATSFRPTGWLLLLFDETDLRDRAAILTAAVPYVPLNAAARCALDAYLVLRHDQHPALFLNRSGERFSVRGVALLVNRYLRRIGVTDRSGPHLLRHTFASHSLRARPNLRAVQELLGHSSVTTTQRYTHMSAEDLRQQVAGPPGSH